MKKLKPREKVILFVTLGLMGVFIVYNFALKPMHEGSADINDQLRVKSARLIKTRQMLEQKALVESRYQDLAILIGGVDSDDAQMPTIISKIDAAARESNIHIANIQPQKTSTQKEASFLAVELEIDGQWLDIVQFLNLLQKKPNFYFLDELNLEKYSDTTSSLRGRIVISRMYLVNL